MSKLGRAFIRMPGGRDVSQEITGEYVKELGEKIRDRDFQGAAQVFAEMYTDRARLGDPVVGKELESIKQVFEDAKQRVLHEQSTMPFLENARKHALSGETEKALSLIAGYRKVSAKEGVPILRDQVREIQSVAYARGAEILLTDITSKMNRLSMSYKLPRRERAQLSMGVLKDLKTARTYANKSGYTQVPLHVVADVREAVKSYGTPGARLVNMLGSYGDRLKDGMQRAGYFKRK